MEKMGSVFARIGFLLHVQVIDTKWGASTAGEPEQGVERRTTHIQGLNGVQKRRLRACSEAEL